MTYRDLAVRLGVSVEAARRRALRGKWARLPGNDGMTRVRPPDELSDRCAPDVRSDAVPDNPALVTALEGHIATLKADVEALRAQLTEFEARAEKQAADPPISSPARGSGPTGRSARSRLWQSASTRWRPRRSRPWWRRLAGSGGDAEIRKDGFASPSRTASASERRRSPDAQAR